MIQAVSEYAPYMDFLDGFLNDPLFSHPGLATEERMRGCLDRAVSKPDRRAFGVFDGRGIIGLFVFLALPEEKYLEMLAGLSREGAAYDEMLLALRAQYPGCAADFVFNPNNALLKGRLEECGARFDAEQQKMVFSHSMPAVDAKDVRPLSPEYVPQYLAMHNTDLYWTGERVIQATDRFRTLIALRGDTVTGYVDVTFGHDENEPCDLLVKEEYRGMGYGRQLLAKALQLNEPKDMRLLVDTDNRPAIRLYSSMGFVTTPNQNSRNAHWKIPG